MSQFTDVSAWITERLPGLIADSHVPAAAVGVLHKGEVFTYAAGVLNKATGVEATPDSVFQIGSITKVWTTTLVMQLVDEGKLDLDAPVRDTVPAFAIGDDAAAQAITTRMLLSHVAGFEGDLFNDTGTGDDAVEKYLATIADAAQLFTPGERFSYNNAAFVVLGRIVEVLREMPYNRALHQYLAGPLGLKEFATNAAEAIMFRPAIGHLPTEANDEWTPAPVYHLPPSNAPAGSMLAMSPASLLAFAQMHISGGVAADGTQVLSAESVAAMQTPQVDLPMLGLMGDQWGLGWELFNWDGGFTIGHDGGTLGQNAFLRVVPGAELAVVLFCNGGNSVEVFNAIFRHAFAELAGVSLPEPIKPSDDGDPIDLDYVLGTYSSTVADTVVSVDDEGRVWLAQTMKGIFATLGPAPEPIELVGWRGNSLLPLQGRMGMFMPHAFVGDDGNGRALYLHTGRADRRVGA